MLGKPEDIHQMYLGDAYWAADNVLVMHGRWVETCIEDTYKLVFEGNKFRVDSDNTSAFRFFKPKPIYGERV